MTKFSQEVFDKICNRIAEGESLRQICEDEDLPAARNVHRWLDRDDADELRQQYARAKEDQAEHYAAEIIEIADNARNDWMERNGGDDEGYNLNGEHVQRSKLRIDARKWVASKLAPKKYGDSAKLEVTGEDGGPIEHKTIERIIVDPAG